MLLRSCHWLFCSSPTFRIYSLASKSAAPQSLLSDSNDGLGSIIISLVVAISFNHVLEIAVLIDSGSFLLYPSICALLLHLLMQLYDRTSQRNIYIHTAHRGHPSVTPPSSLPSSPKCFFIQCYHRPFHSKSTATILLQLPLWL